MYGGPATNSVGRNKYYVSFIDDYSKFTWVYLLRFKSEVFQKFYDFQNMVERMFDSKIIVVQTDWGGEYQKLSSFFTKIGVAHLVSCPHAHQQNGPAERKHKHIVEVGLALLAHASIPLKLWDEAFATAAYLINRTPSKVIDFMTPYERLFHKKPDYKFLRVFGCACWPNLRPYNTHKLAFRSKRCVFLGYSSSHKGYKCLDVSTGRVYISRDVIFDEGVFPFREFHPNVGARLRAEVNLLPHLFPSSTTMNYPGDTNVADSLLPDIQNTQNSAPNDTSLEENSGACAQEILEQRSSTIPGAGSASLRNDGNPSTSSDGGPIADMGQEPTGPLSTEMDFHIRMSLALGLLYQIMLQQQIFHAGPTGSENQKHTQMAL
jgi:hypothetical protein